MTSPSELSDGLSDGRKPSGLRNPRGAVRGLGSVTLIVEAVVLLLALAPLSRVINGPGRSPAIWLCLFSTVLAVALVGLLKHAWAWWVGGLVPLALILGGVRWHWSLIAVGVIFGLTWIYVLYVRRSILSGGTGGLAGLMPTAEASDDPTSAGSASAGSASGGSGFDGSAPGPRDPGA